MTDSRDNSLGTAPPGAQTGIGVAMHQLVAELYPI